MEFQSPDTTSIWFGTETFASCTEYNTPTAALSFPPPSRSPSTSGEPVSAVPSHVRPGIKAPRPGYSAMEPSGRSRSGIPPTQATALPSAALPSGRPGAAPPKAAMGDSAKEEEEEVAPVRVAIYGVVGRGGRIFEGPFLPHSGIVLFPPSKCLVNLLSLYYALIASLLRGETNGRLRSAVTLASPGRL